MVTTFIIVVATFVIIFFIDSIWKDEAYQNMPNLAEYTIGITSMYANPIHPGHIECLELSKEHCDELWVIVNNDKQAELKRGVPSFQDEQYRLNVIKAIKYVDQAYIAEDKDGSVCESIKTLYATAQITKPNCKVVFTKGGDRFVDNIPEKKN